MLKPRPLKTQTPNGGANQLSTLAFIGLQYIWSDDTVDDMYTVAVAVLGGGCTARTYVLQRAHILVLRLIGGVLDTIMNM